jgi:DMSO/TMAO reductase YedYZ molybdopterin-dependent catalytic subunit
MPEQRSDAMSDVGIPRRDVMTYGGATLAGLALLQVPSLAKAFPVRPGEEVVPWADQPPPHARPQAVPRQLRWEEFDSLLTPNDRFFLVGHYGFPAVDAAAWTLSVTGQVRRPLTLTLDQIKARPRREVVYTLECSGNHGFPFMVGGIGTARWAGTPLAPVLEEAGIREGGIEVVFHGADTGEEQIRDVKVQSAFARSLSVADATRPEMLLCYEMNGEPLPRENGFPVRLIAPGWYGVANVKWLSRIEVLDTRYMGRFMGRDYVTVREEEVGGKKLAVETSVGRALLKSVPGRVTRLGGQYRIVGAAWGGDVARVEVRIDGGPWQAASIDRGEASEFAWKPWFLDWPAPSPGEHAITSRATDAAGKVQPAMDDPLIANKKTYWESNGQVTRRVRVA